MVDVVVWVVDVVDVVVWVMWVSWFGWGAMCGGGDWGDCGRGDSGGGVVMVVADGR